MSPTPGTTVTTAHLLPPISASGYGVLAKEVGRVIVAPASARDEFSLPPIAPKAPDRVINAAAAGGAQKSKDGHYRKSFSLAARAEFSGTVKHAMLDFNANAAAPRLVSIIKAFLERQEGSSLKAWLRHFDTNNDRRISLDEFVDGMHKLNFRGDIGDIKNAFSILDSDGSGELTLAEIDATQYKLWKSFCSWCTTLFEDPEDMLIRIRSSASSRMDETPSTLAPSPSSPTSQMDMLLAANDAALLPKSQDLAIDQQTFVQGLEALGWREGNEELIYQSLDVYDTGVIETKNLQWLEKEKRKIKNRETAKRTAVNANRRALAAKAAAEDRRRLDSTLHDFKVFLKRKYGNYVRAWRRALSNGSLLLQKHELFKGCNKIGWRGDVRLLWTALDRDENGSIAIEELDSKGAELLAHFHKCIMEHFGSASLAFRSFDRQNMKKLRLEDFEAGLRQCGFKLPVKPIYQGLDFEGHKFVTEQDFQILENWKPPAFLSVAANPSAADEFRKRLLEEHGNYLKGWRHCLDTDQSNRCAWREYVTACKKLKFNGDYAGAWRVLDQDVSGYITLGELDAEANDTLLEFRRWTYEEFGNVASAFNAFVLWTKWDQLRQEKRTQQRWEAQWDQRHSVIAMPDESSPKSNKSRRESRDSDGRDLLENFKRWAGEEFGASAFKVQDDESEITYRQFKNACIDFGLQLDTFSLFHALDVEGNQKLSLSEIKFLDHWEWRLPHESFEDLGDTGLGIHHHSYAPQELMEYETASPGPGSYNIRSPILNFRDPSVKFAGAFSFGRQQARLPYIDKDCALYPSPFEYNKSHCISDAGLALGKPSWSFTREERSVVAPKGPPSKTPGPHEYRLPANAGPHVPHVTCSPRRVLRAHPLFRNR